VTGELLVSIYVFVLAAFLGFELITKVPPTLHTPLMSGANAMSGITIVGALGLAAVSDLNWATGFAVAALVLATINVVGGFLVTDRMLGEFGDKR
jgi:H+-translocating NAD(P) transhydrogenase subunit alpha